MNIGQPISTGTLEIRNPSALTTVKLITIVGMPLHGRVVWSIGLVGTTRITAR